MKQRSAVDLKTSDLLRHRAAIEAVLVRRGVPERDLPDVVQDVFVRAWQSMQAGRFRPPPRVPVETALERWILGLARRQASQTPEPRSSARSLGGSSVRPGGLREAAPDLERAWNRLFRAETFWRVTKWLSQLGVPRGDLADVMQAVWLEIIKSFPTYDPVRARLDRWLNGIAVHVASHHCDKAYLRHEVLVEPTALNVVVDVDGTSVLEVILTEERRGLLLEIISRLPDDQVWILSAYHLHGCSMQELAEMRGIPLSTAYKRHARAFAAAQAIARELQEAEPRT